MFLVCLNKFILSFFPLCFILEYHVHTNANFGPWWVGTWLDNFPTTKHTNS